MPVELYQKVNKEKIGQLPFVEATHAFGYVDTNSKSRLGIVYEINRENANKMKLLLAGKEERQIVKGDKVFVLSGCKIPQFKIREFLRGIKAVMVSEIEEANVFVGNSRVYQEHDANLLNELDSLCMVMQTPYYTAANCADDRFEDVLERDEVLDAYHPAGTVSMARFNKFASARHGTYTGGSGIRLMFCAVPYAMRVVYELLSRKVPTINEECLVKQMPTSSVLDRELCDRVMQMMKSDDKENGKLAHEILANSDYKESELYLYKIARSDGYFGISGSRFKNVKLFYRESGLSRYRGLGEERFTQELLEKQKLTKEAMDHLMPMIAEKYERQLSDFKSSIYKVKIELRPEFMAVLQDPSYNREYGAPGDTNTDDDNDDSIIDIDD